MNHYIKKLDRDTKGFPSLESENSEERHLSSCPENLEKFVAQKTPMN